MADGIGGGKDYTLNARRQCVDSRQACSFITNLSLKLTKVP